MHRVLASFAWGKNVGGKVVNSVSSVGPELVFELPAVPENSKTYYVWFIHETTKLYNMAYVGSQRVMNVTVSHNGVHECVL